MGMFRTFATLAALAASGGAFADTDCNDPVAAWQPRETLRRQVELRGWTVQRIKVDDGCFEVRGLDRLGNKVKAKYAPATLRIRSLEVDFGPDGDASDYFHQERPVRLQQGRPGPSSKGTFP